jgi:hypothetical protein
MNKGAKTEREARRQREQTLPPILKTQKPKTPTTRKLKLSSQTQMHGPEKNPLTRLRTRDNNNTLGLEEKRRKKNPANPPPHTHPPKKKKKNQKLAGKKTKTRKDREKEQPKKNNSNTAAAKTSTTTKRKEREGSKVVLRCATRKTQMDSRRQSSARPADRIPADSSYPPAFSSSGEQPGTGDIPLRKAGT